MAIMAVQPVTLPAQRFNKWFITTLLIDNRVRTQPIVHAVWELCREERDGTVVPYPHDANNPQTTRIEHIFNLYEKVVAHLDMQLPADPRKPMVTQMLDLTIDFCATIAIEDGILPAVIVQTPVPPMAGPETSPQPPAVVEGANQASEPAAPPTTPETTTETQGDGGVPIPPPPATPT